MPHARAVGNKSRQENSLRRRKRISPPEQLRESARGSHPSHPPSPGGVGEQSAPRSCRRRQSRQENSLHRRKRMSPPEQLRESARGSHSSRPRPPRGCRGAERPTPAPSETVSPKGQPASSKTNISARTAPESSRRCEPSRLPIEAGDLRGGKVACPKGKQVASRPTKRNRRFRLVAPGADFFGAGGLAPRRKNRFLADSAPGNPKDFSEI